MRSERYKLPLPAPLEYVPPFVSQKPDRDGSIDDCTWAAGLMLVATWTSGEVVTAKRGRIRGERGLRRLRRLLREASGERGPASLQDLSRGVGRFWKELRPLDGFIHGAAYGRPYSFDQLWKALNARSCAVVQGQRPADAGKGALYPTTGPHAVFVHRADPEFAYVQDPMRTYRKGKRRMRKVPRAELERFAAGIGGGPNCLVVVRGSERPARRVLREASSPAG